MLGSGRLTRQSDTFKISYLPERNEFPALPSLDFNGIVCGRVCVCECVCKLIVLIFGRNRLSLLVKAVCPPIVFTQ